MYLSVRFLAFLVFSFVVGIGTAEGGLMDDAPAPTDTAPIKNGASSVQAADLNGDGYIDIVSASDGDGELAWYPNDGDGNFPEKKIIKIGGVGAQDLHVADLDGDNNPDLLAAFGSTNKVAWYENNGNGSFSEQNVITSDAAGAVSVHAADLSGNGNLDVLSASQLDGKIAYYENGGGGDFSDQNVISDEGEGAKSVHAGDLDGDDDPDVVYASSVRAGGSKVAWHRNTAAGFSNQNVITTRRRGASTVRVTDLNNDGSPDILAAFSEFGRGQLAWSQNPAKKTAPGMQVISSEMQGVNSVMTIDLDGNGEKDIVTSSSVASADGEISYFRSTAGTFGSKAVIADNLLYSRSVYAADLNENGVPDVIGASQDTEKIAWYENDLLRGFGFREPVMIGE